MIESWSFDVLFLDQIQSKKKRLIGLFSFSFIFLFNFHKVENVYEVEHTPRLPSLFLPLKKTCN